MDTIEKLTELFRQFPGIGPRQARRFVYYLLTQSHTNIDDLTNLIKQLKQSIAVCSSCYRYYPLNERKAPNELCSICNNPERDRSTLMIVSRDIDLQAMEKSRAYDGLYFVLGGAVPILDEAPQRRIRQQELEEIVTARVDDINTPLKEIIIATSVNPEGEHTSLYVTTLLKSITEKKQIKVSTLGRGLSTGTELEYSDADTIKSALENRK
ncbi:MAG: toprim domain-containing protein [Patescibacteria group bacterium]